MKFAVAVLIGATQAISLNDAPPYFDEPDWRETFPSAAGLVQTGSACARAGAAGVFCLEENNMTIYLTAVEAASLFFSKTLSSDTVYGSL